jgi:hypothetical protein
MRILKRPLSELIKNTKKGRPIEKQAHSKPRKLKEPSKKSCSIDSRSALFTRIFTILTKRILRSNWMKRRSMTNFNTKSMRKMTMQSSTKKKTNLYLEEISSSMKMRNGCWSLLKLRTMTTLMTSKILIRKYWANGRSHPSKLP